MDHVEAGGLTIGVDMLHINIPYLAYLYNLEVRITFPDDKFLRLTLDVSHKEDEL